MYLQVTRGGGRRQQQDIARQDSASRRGLDNMVALLGNQISQYFTIHAAGVQDTKAKKDTE